MIKRTFDRNTMSYEKCKACEFKIEFSAKGTCGSRWVCKLTGKELMLQNCPKPCQSSQDKQDDLLKKLLAATEKGRQAMAK